MRGKANYSERMAWARAWLIYVLHNRKIVCSMHAKLLYFIVTVCVLHIMGTCNEMPVRGIVEWACRPEHENWSENNVAICIFGFLSRFE